MLISRIQDTLNFVEESFETIFHVQINEYFINFLFALPNSSATQKIQNSLSANTDR
jgi:hypothetical protein